LEKSEVVEVVEVVGVLVEEKKKACGTIRTDGRNPCEPQVSVMATRLVRNRLAYIFVIVKRLDMKKILRARDRTRRRI
jgi:hypothetical protein